MHDLGFQHVHEPATQPDAAFTALLLHGTGADERDLVPLGRMVAPGKPLLSPLGKVRENGAPRWFRRHAEGVFDEDDLRGRAAELADFLRRARDAYKLPPYVAVGFSNGANVAAALLLLHPGVLRGAVLLRAMPPLRDPPAADLRGVPVYVAAGTDDPLIPPGQARVLADVLTRAGADATLRFARAGHGLTPAEVADARGWLAAREDDLRRPRP